MWHDIWKNCGRPGSGIIHKIKCSCKLKNKSAIKKPSVTTKMKIMMNFMNIFSTKKYQNFGNVGPQNFTKTFQKRFTLMAVIKMLT